jgi:macrolide-specific efflux system membrane fusion protein
LDRLQLAVERTRLEIEQAQHVLSVARLTTELKKNAVATATRRLERLTIRAPIDGLVAQVYRRHGEWVEPGQQVVRILRIDRLRAEGFVTASQLDDLPVGSPVELLVKRDNERVEAFLGTLVHVSPEIDPVNNQVRIWAEVDNAAMKLKPGMRGAMLVRPEDDASGSTRQ